MNKIIINPSVQGGIALFTPAENDRRQVLVQAAVYQTRVYVATDGKPEREEQVLVSPAVYRPETDTEFLTRLAAQIVPPNTEYQIIDIADVPTDRTFRNAWEYSA